MNLKKPYHMNLKEYNKELEQEDWIMNFKKTYQKEMDTVCCPETIPAASQTNRQQFYQKRILQTASILAAMLCLTIGMVNKNHIISFAESILQSFTLSADKNTMKLDLVEPKTFNQEAFCADPMTEMIESTASDGSIYKHFWRNFNTYKKMHDLTGFTFPNAELIEYKDLVLDVVFENGYGHLSVKISYQGMNFRANGMFVTEAFGQEQWGYGEDDQISEIYEYTDGHYAYFFESIVPLRVANRGCGVGRRKIK